MARKTFIPRFEETEAAIRERTLDRIEGWRKLPGDFAFDMVVPAVPEIQQLRINQDTTLRASFAQYAEGSDLDALLFEVGLERDPATPNKRSLNVTADAGVVIPKDYTAVVVVLDANGDPLEFNVNSDVTFATTGTLAVNITARNAGTIGNLVTGSQFIFLPPIPGVRSIVDTGTTLPGTEQETDEAAFAKYEFKVQHPDTGGNKNDYVRWAQEIDGVGKVKVVPRWDGVGTVKLVLLDQDSVPAVTAVVDAVQAYIDPDSEGLGGGKAPMGAAVTVDAATALPLVIVADVTWAIGADTTAGKAAFEAQVRAYLKTIAFVSSVGTGDPVPAVYNRIAALLTFTEGITNFTTLTVNGGVVDITPGDDEVVTLGSVTLT